MKPTKEMVNVMRLALDGVAHLSFDEANAALTAALAAMPGPVVMDVGQEVKQNYNCPCIHPSQCDNSCLTPATDLQAENERLRAALETISRVAGNIPDDILCRATGANDARYRGGLVCTARDIANAALERKP